MSVANGQTAAQAADAAQADAETVMGAGKVPRSTATVGGEQAVVLNNLPGQDINRRVYVVHNGVLYVFMFYPLDPNNAAQGQAMEPLYQTVISSFHFLQ